MKTGKEESKEKQQAIPTGESRLEKAIQWVQGNGFRLLYWTINLIVMAYSAQNGGHLFGKYESVGIILPLIFDALIIVFTQSLLVAKARGDGWRVLQILLFIVLCTAINLVANVYASLEQDIKFPSTIWIAPILPYVVSCMPIFLFCLALIADYAGMSVIRKPTEEEMAYSRHDPEQFKRRELNRLKIKATKVRMRELSALIDTRTTVLAAIKRREKRGHYKKLPMGELQTALETLNQAINDIIAEPNKETMSEQPSEQIEVSEVNASVDTEEVAEENETVNESGNVEETQERTAEETPRPRITQPLSEQHGKRERTTDELTAVNKTVSQQRTSASTADAQKRVLRVLKKYPSIGPTELAEKAKVSKGYASKIKSQVATGAK